MRLTPFPRLNEAQNALQHYRRVKEGRGYASRMTASGYALLKTILEIE